MRHDVPDRSWIDTPVIGSLWAMPRSNVAQGHERGDVIIVTTDRVHWDVADGLFAGAMGHVCLNRRGLTFYPDIWWETDGSGCHRHVVPVIGGDTTA